MNGDRLSQNRVSVLYCNIIISRVVNTERMYEDRMARLVLMAEVCGSEWVKVAMGSTSKTMDTERQCEKNRKE